MNLLLLFSHRLVPPVKTKGRTFALLLLSLACFSGSIGQAHARDRAGDFDYYALVLSWSPTHCASLRRNIYDPQCHRRDGRRYAFVLHGLWPQYERGYPEFCRTRARPFVPNRVINRMLDIMPSRKLVIHEYKKHGTCSGLTPDDYYDLSRQLYEKIKIPKRFINPFKNQIVSPQELEAEFLRVNPDLDAGMISISCRGSGSRLREVMICFSREGKLRHCGVNESQRRLCRAKRMFVPPVRSSTNSQSKSQTNSGQKTRDRQGQLTVYEDDSPLPGPVMPDSVPLPGPR